MTAPERILSASLIVYVRADLYDAAVAERDRLRKLFDDAGHGEHNVLALVDHYQRESMNADERVAELTAERDEARVENARLTKMLDVCNVVHQHNVKLVAERDAARKNYAFMVERAANEKLDGYRELAMRAAKAENERDDAMAALAKMRTRAIAAEQLPAFEKGDLERAHQSCAADFKALHERLEKAEAERDEAKRLLAEAVEARDEAMREAETLERERDALRAEVDLLRKVAKAADDACGAVDEEIERDALARALAAYRAAKEKTP